LIRQFAVTDNSAFKLGDWHVVPSTNTLIKGKTHCVVEPKAMDVLLMLCQAGGDVVSADTLLAHCWPNGEHGDNPVHKTIAQLRKALNDSSRQPLFIKTIRKRGYCIIAPVETVQTEQHQVSQIHWKGGSPFAGLQAFEVEQADVFFGRTRHINQLVERLTRLIQEGHALALVLGPSGSGKTSLVQAGLLPRFIRKDHISGICVVSHLTFDIGNADVDRLWLDFASYLFDWEVQGDFVFSDVSSEQLAEQLQHNPDAVLARCKALLNAYSEMHDVPHPRFFITLDRLEVLLDSPLYSKETKQGFIKFVDSMARSGAVIVVATCRNDFYPLITQYPALLKSKDKGGHFDLTPPTPTEIIQMIRLPAAAAGLKWEQEPTSKMSLDEIIAKEAYKTPDALPLLQYTLNELYLQRDGITLTLHAYKALGGIDGAIGRQADVLVAKLDAGQQRALDDVFSMLITVNEDSSSVTSRSAKYASLLSEAHKRVVDLFVSNRLFVSDIEHTEPSFRLAHEALLRSWSRMTAWLEEHRSALHAKSRIKKQANQWVAEGKDKAYLLPEGKPLNEAKVLLRNKQILLSNQEQALIHASSSSVRLRHRVKKAFVALLTALTLISVGLTMISVNALNFAENKRDDAEDLLGFMVGEFADQLRSVRRMDLLDDINTKASDYFSQQQRESHWFDIFKSEQDRLEARLKQALILKSIAEVDYSRGQNQSALKSFRSAESILLTEPGHLAQPELLFELGELSFWIGQIHLEEGDIDTAQRYFERYLSYAETQHRLAMSPEQVNNAKVELSYAYNALGTVALEKSDYLAAEDAFRQSVEQKQATLSSPTEQIDLIVDIADSYSWLASTQLELGKISDAADNYEKGKSLLIDALEEHPDNANINESTAYIVFNMLDLQLRTGQKSIEQAQNNIKLAQQAINNLLSQDEENQFWQSLYFEFNTFVIKSSLLSENAALPEQEYLQQAQTILQDLEKQRIDDIRVWVPLTAVFIALQSEEFASLGIKKIEALAAEAQLSGKDAVNYTALKAAFSLLLGQIPKANAYCAEIQKQFEQSFTKYPREYEHYSKPVLREAARECAITKLLIAI